MGQNGQNENFHRHNTTVKWLKAIVLSFWASYVKFWCAVLKKKLKNDFLPKMAKNGEKRPNENFFQDVALCKKKSKSDARFSRYGVTDARTDARTQDERESIGLNG